MGYSIFDYTDKINDLAEQLFKELDDIWNKLSVEHNTISLDQFKSIAIQLESKYKATLVEIIQDFYLQSPSKNDKIHFNSVIDNFYMQNRITTNFFIKTYKMEIEYFEIYGQYTKHNEELSKASNDIKANTELSEKILIESNQTIERTISIMSVLTAVLTTIISVITIISNFFANIDVSLLNIKSIAIIFGLPTLLILISTIILILSIKFFLLPKFYRKYLKDNK